MNIEDEDKEDAIHFYKSGVAEKNDFRKELLIYFAQTME